MENWNIASVSHKDIKQHFKDLAEDLSSSSDRVTEIAIDDVDFLASIICQVCLVAMPFFDKLNIRSINQLAEHKRISYRYFLQFIRNLDFSLPTKVIKEALTKIQNNL